ncbi:uncharacterized protein G2W53_033494 [Senna tora]|uniref:Uncharacterized protein n=1 Tax=Senna tora TaxID=362788 RepID=A0A834SZ92_9FABA|nr:uncharacterized protein G2W53_033494 [Senna tora]
MGVGGSRSSHRCSQREEGEDMKQGTDITRMGKRK